MKRYVNWTIGIFNLYILFSILFASSGIRQIVALKTKFALLQKQYGEITSQNELILWQLNALTEPHINKEFLDEVLKKHISYSNFNEKVIITEDGI